MGEFKDRFLLISEYEGSPVHKKLHEYKAGMEPEQARLLLGPAGITNGLLSWTLVPSGSKIGWDTYIRWEEHLEAIKQICLEAGADYTEVLMYYSLDHTYPRIEETSKRGRKG